MRAMLPALAAATAAVAALMLLSHPQPAAARRASLSARGSMDS
jgi:hypothetical protein